MEQTPSFTVAVAWDQSARAAYSQVSLLASSRTPGNGTFEVPGLSRTAGNLLVDQVVPMFQRAAEVLVLWSENDPLWVGFQAGLAEGLGLPWHVVAAPAETASAVGLPGGVGTVRSIDEMVDSIVTKVPPEDPGYEPSSGSYEAPPPVEPILLCPRETAGDRTLLDLLRSVTAPRTYRRIGPKVSTKSPSADVVWVITPYDPDRGDESNLRPNLGNAFEAGRGYGAAVAGYAQPQLAIIRVGPVPPIVALEHLSRSVDNAEQAAAMLRTGQPGELRMTQLALRDIKCFESITIPLSVESPLEGAWTCLAGVNGAGKSTALQALALALLGRQRAPELGLSRLGRMVRRGESSPSESAEIRLTIDDGTGARDIVLPLTSSGIDERRLASMTDQSIIEDLWQRLAQVLVVSYGATRNISDSPSGQLSMSPSAHRQLTLFDPLAQIVSSDALTSGGPTYRPVLETVAALAMTVLKESEAAKQPDALAPFKCSVDDGGHLVFQREGATLSSLDLPDGFRSILALLADIASGWHELHPPSAGETVSGEDIDGIVLVDELDLHLHARLQRNIVPRLREALPRVQWVITTHSPYIVGSFDQTEIVLLDRSQKSGIRQLDRQVLGFTTNEINDWLLGAPAISAAGEAELAKDSATALLYQSPTRDRDAAEKLLSEQDELLDKLRATKA